MKPAWADKTFLISHIPLSAPESSVSDKALSHIFSQQCKPKQLRIGDLPNNEADLQEITLKGPGRLTLKNNFEPLLSL